MRDHIGEVDVLAESAKLADSLGTRSHVTVFVVQLQLPGIFLTKLIVHIA